MNSNESEIQSSVPPAPIPDSVKESPVTLGAEHLNEIQLEYRYNSADLRAIKRHSSTVTKLNLVRNGLIILGPLILLLVSISLANMMLMIIAGLVVFMLILARLRQYWALRSYHLDTIRHTRLTSDFFENRVSKTKLQILWQAFEALRETKDHFLFVRHGSCCLLPKRVMSDSQISSLRSWLAQVQENQLSNHELMQLEAPAYRQLMAEVHESECYHWSWQDEDVMNLSKAKLQVYSAARPARPNGRRFWMYAYLVFLIVGVSYLSIASDEPLVMMFIVPILVIIGYFLYLWLIGHVIRWLAQLILSDMKIKPKLPVLMTLTKQALVFSDKASSSIHHWDDIEAFYTEKNLLAFSGVEKVLQAFPKRIFEGRSDAFLQMAIRLKQQAVIETEVPHNAEIIETGNPFQPPPNAT